MKHYIGFVEVWVDRKPSQLSSGSVGQDVDSRAFWVFYARILG
jgi:hypothetical protein